jgi:hypothetical protein
MDLEVYCDESRQELFRHAPRIPGQYVLIGGVWIQAAEREEYKAKINRIREVHRVYGEFKWKRVTPSRQEFYRQLVGLFFDEAMRFRCMVLPADRMDAVTFHRGDKELMFYKFYYQLLHPWILDFNRYRVFLDLKTNRVDDRVTTLGRVLSHANLTSQVTVQALPSQQLDLLQLADVLIGAVGYRFHRLTTSAAKLAVLEEVEGRLGHPIQPTTRNVEKFNIFKFAPGGGW